MIRLKKIIILFISVLLPLSVVHADECSALENEAEKIKCYETKSADVQRKVKIAQGDKLESDKRQAESGDMTAQYAMGQRYYLGRGVEQDIHKAIEWWEKAAEQGHLQAQKDLARWSGVLGDTKKTDKWTKKGTELGDHESKYQLALRSYLSGDYSKILELLGEAEKGASCKNISMQKWQKVATAWQVNVKLLLGFIYFEGSGVSKDYNKSSEWFVKATECENSYEGAGLLYHLKKVRPASFSDLIKWLKDEEKNGNQDSIKVIKYLESQGLIEH